VRVKRYIEQKPIVMGRERENEQASKRGGKKEVESTYQQLMKGLW
jgi:hypothetical protein